MTLSKADQKRFEKHLEAQGCRMRTTRGGGWVIHLPNGAQTTIHLTDSDVRSEKNSIAFFRRNGIHHPNDPKELPVPETDAEYPDYITAPIAQTTRKKILAALESQGWPPEVEAKQLPLDTVTALRALYNVGYRLKPGSTVRKRVWLAPEDILELHRKVKADQEARAQADRERRAAERAAHLAAVETRDEEGNVLDVRPYQNPGPTIEESADPEWLAENVSTPDTPDEEPEEQGLIGVVMPPEPEPEKSLDEELEMVLQTTPIGTTEVLAKPTPEREFIDSVDSWTVDEHWYLPREVSSYLESLRGAGLGVEIRVWREA